MRERFQSRSSLNQIAALLSTPKDTIKVKYIDIQMQSGSTDCGIFAVAFATALANGEPPGALIFNQPERRKHLMECLELQFLSAFPIMRKRRSKRRTHNPWIIVCIRLENTESKTASSRISVLEESEGQ